MKFRQFLSPVAATVFLTFSTASAANPSPPPVLQIYSAEGAAVAPNLLYLGTPANWASVVPKGGSGAANAGSIKVEPVPVGSKKGLKITWTGGIGQIYSQSKTASDQMDYLDADGALVFDAIVHSAPEDQIQMRIDCRHPCMGIFDATAMYKAATIDKSFEVKIPLSCFEAGGTRFTAVNTPFLIFASKKFSLSVADIRWVPGAGKDADAVKC